MRSHLVCTVQGTGIAREAGTKYRVRLRASRGRGSAYRDFAKKKDAEDYGQRFVRHAMRKRQYSASYTIKKITPDIAWIYK